MRHERKPFISDSTFAGVLFGTAFLGVTFLVTLPIFLMDPIWSEHKYPRGSRVAYEDQNNSRVLKCISTPFPGIPEYKIRIKNLDGSLTEIVVFEDELTEKRNND